MLRKLGPWDWFVTLTFANPVHPRTAEDRWHRWLRLLQRDLYGPRWEMQRDVYGHGLTWTLAVERQRRGVIHFHALLAGPDLERAVRQRWETIWRGVAAGRPAVLERDRKGFLRSLDERRRRNPRANWARIEIPRADAVANYCAKYTVKGGEVEIHRPLGGGRRATPHSTPRDVHVTHGSALWRSPASLVTSSQSRR